MGDATEADETTGNGAPTGLDALRTEERSLASSARSSVQELKDEVRSPGWREVIASAMRHMRVDRVTVAAGAFAYRWFLSIFPTIIALLGVASLVDAAFDRRRSHSRRGAGAAVERRSSLHQGHQTGDAQHEPSSDRDHPGLARRALERGLGHGRRRAGTRHGLRRRS